MNPEREKELQQIAASMLPSPMISTAYVEHQMDLISSLLMDLFARLDPESLTPDIQAKLSYLQQAMTFSSVDFSNLSEPLQSYKLPAMIEKKWETRIVQNKYLLKLKTEGLL